MADRLSRYADLIVRIGANVQPGQTVFVNADLEHADLVRAVAHSAYEAGAAYVDAAYTDQHVRRAMIEHASEDVLTETPAWGMQRIESFADGGALISIPGDPRPHLLADLDPERVGKAKPLEGSH